MAVVAPGRGDPVIPAAPAGPEAATHAGDVPGDPAVTAAHRPAEAALGLRDEALAALDAGDPPAALTLAQDARHC